MFHQNVNMCLVVSCYGETQAADMVRARCDTYADYHFERRANFGESCYGSNKIKELLNECRNTYPPQDSLLDHASDYY
ncbi:MAG: hypothetical protein LKK12_04935 [Bacteroidales bacterium]|jgi:hypothetical protein|nr:hypothetical protein [Bacteroidales bacterium]